MSEVKKFRASFKKMPIILEVDGKEVEFLVREFDGEARTKYLSWMSSHTEAIGGDEAQRRIVSTEGFYEAIIGPSLYEKDNNPENKIGWKPVNPEFIRFGIPAESLEGIADIVRSLNGLTKETAEVEKK